MARFSRIASKIYLLVAVATGSLLTVGALSLLQARRAEAALVRVTEVDQALLTDLQTLYAAGLQSGQATRNILLAAGKDAAGRSNLADSRRAFLAALEDARRLAPAAARQQLERIAAIWSEDDRLKDQVVELASSGRAEEGAQLLRQQETPVWREARALILELLQRQQAQLTSTRDGAVASSQRSRWLLLAVLVAALAAFALLSFRIARGAGRTIALLIAEAARLREAVAAGRLDVRGDAAAIEPEFRPVVVGFNETMDAFTGPFREAAASIGRLSRGEEAQPIATAYTGDFNAVKDSINGLIDVVRERGLELDRLIRGALEGRLDVRADAARFQGADRRLIQGMNDVLDALAKPVQLAADHVARIARGDIPPRITAASRGEFKVLLDNLNLCIEAVNLLVTDAGALARAGVEGRLATRADAARHQGDFRKVVEGVNQTLDAVIGPLNVATRYVDEISKGRIPARITEAYPGDFDALKDGLNTCIEAVNRLVADANGLVDAAVAGRLSTRADASRHQGDFRRVVEGINQTMDAVLAPIGEAAEVLERLAQRDLRSRMRGSYQGDHARIKESVNATGQALHDALAQVAEAVDQVSSASQQIAASSQAVASGASEQAASLQETTSSLASVLSITGQATDHSQQANALARTARGAATEGASAVEQMQGAMGKIRASAEGTSQIIRDINDIAFQTNLLALNAAVEAARAGEAGRGFAVVAEEVRSLALRAKEAAQKTEALIKESVRQAGEGAVTAGLLAGKLAGIVTGIGQVSDLVSEIAAAAREQAAGIGQVSGAVGEMDKVTQQNAASAEESSSAASELNGQAEELAAMVGAFRLSRSRGAAAAPAPARMAGSGGAPP